MFEMGFEAQVRSICDHVRPDRQIMLFSATFKKKIERLARDSLVDPVKIVQVCHYDHFEVFSILFNLKLHSIMICYSKSQFLVSFLKAKNHFVLSQL